MSWKALVPTGLTDRYEVLNHRHAAEILSSAFPESLREIYAALSDFALTTEDIRKPGGNQSEITDRFASLLRPRGWIETRISADLVVREAYGRAARKERRGEPKFTKEAFIDGHRIDFVKDRIALDFEWNSKDQTFDRDLVAFRAFYECDAIAAGVLITRSAELDRLFAALGPEVKAKYGASTTWMGKLKYRLDAGRGGG
ncbi:MAG: restriction endonuclease [Alphaproteobacteria bacterium]|nr:restriction endonuclease [Alphaproteobacteria bacterium]